MLTLERVKALIKRLAPSGICDGCLSEAVKIETRSEARALARQLVGHDGLERANGSCCMCRNVRAVTRKTK